MKINYKTRKSHTWNEDRYIIGTNFWIVIDGATPLIKNGDMNLARYMVSYVKKNINRYGGRIRERLIKLSKDLFVELGIDSRDPAYLPTASISYVEEIDGKYYAGVLGDCEVTFITHDGEIIRCFAEDLSKLDHISKCELENEAKKHHISIREARKHITDILIKNRRLINQDGGYQGYTVSPNLTFREVSCSVDKERVKEIYLYSDGFSASFQCFDIYPNHQEMFKNTLDIELETKRIVEVAFRDKDCNKYHRFKKIDDITVVQICTDAKL